MESKKSSKRILKDAGAIKRILSGHTKSEIVDIIKKDLPVKDKGKRIMEESLELEAAKADLSKVYEKIMGERAEREEESSEEKAEREVSDERLGRLAEVVRGYKPKVEAGTMGPEKTPSIFALGALGKMPPFNVLASSYSKIRRRSLEQELEVANLKVSPDDYAATVVGLGFVLGVVFLVLLLLLTNSVILPVMFFVITLILAPFIGLFIPTARAKTVTGEINKQLPYALRHMSSLLNAGVGIFESISSVAKADYGTLSKELDIVVWDVKSGESLSDALTYMSYRVNSRPFNRVVVHIRRALQMGGNVALIISQIADDLTFDFRMKISDFAEKLNAFAILYLIIGIVGPVVIAIFSLVYSVPFFGVGGGLGTLSVFLYILIFPLLLFMMVYLTKMMEPKV